ncbi:MAG TPA: nuclear transport factor 2 family protein [Pyrinomonadaceae bacterium]|nr:nuclear transport factor 2 family protein [Pyrinomonadaceae bacterium]
MSEQDDTNRQAHNFEIEQRLRHMNEEWVRAFVERDAATLERIMADDFFFTYPLEGDDREQFIGDIVSGDLTAEFLNREKVAVRVFGSTAVLTCMDKAKWFYKGREISGQYKTVHVYSERDGQWQLVAVQACPIT